MKKFPLESVLSYRHELEKVLQEEMASLQNQLSCERDRLKGYLIHREKWEKELTLLQQREDILPAVVNLYLNHQEVLDRKITEQEEVVVGLEAVIEKKRRELLKASRDRKSLEKLEEYFQGKVDLEEKRQEEKFLGELALNSFRRRSSSR